MRAFLSAKATIIMVTLIATFTAGVGGTVLMEELSTTFEGTNEVADVQAIVVQLVEDIQVLTLEIEELNGDIDASQSQIDALIIERDALISDLEDANDSMVQFKIDICTVIDTLPTNQRDNYDLWCGVYGEGIPAERAGTCRCCARRGHHRHPGARRCGRSGVSRPGETDRSVLHPRAC